MFGVFVPPSTAQSGQRQIDEPAANPARPTVSNPATLTPIGYLQFETGVLGAQVVLMPGEGAKPTLAVSYSRRAYDGGAPELDFGSPRNSSVFYASADVKGFHYDANAVFNEMFETGVHRLQFGQTLSI